jgi:hypothetical protein
MSLILQPYFGGRFPLTYSLLPLSVFLKFILGAEPFKIPTIFFFPGKLIFVGRSCFLPKVSGTGLISEGRKTTVVFCEAGGVIVG